MRRLGLIAVVLLFVACSRKDRSNENAPALPPPPAVPVADGGAGPSKPLSGAPRALAANVREPEAIRPDRRFLLALAHVDRILGRAAGAYEAKREADARWTITNGATSVASGLDRFPDYRALMEIVQRHATGDAKVAPQRDAVANGPVDIPIGDAALAQLDLADSLWASDRKKAARAAAIALTGLLFGSEDLLEVADELSARAIAATAVAKALGAELGGAEAVLARILGYGTTGKELAPAGDDDVAAAYAAFDDARLFKSARKTSFARLAWLRRLGFKDDRPGMRAWLDREYGAGAWSIPVLARIVRTSTDLEAARSLERSYAPVVLLDVLSAGADAKTAKVQKARVAKDARSTSQGPGDAIMSALGIERSQLLVQYEAAIAKLPPRSGVFRDATFDRDYFDGNMISAMTAVHDYYGDSLGSSEAVVREAQSLVLPADGARTKAFHTWFSTMAATQSNEQPMKLVRHVTAPSPLGAAARWRVFRRLFSRLDNLVARDQTRGLLSSFFDTRPVHLVRVIASMRDPLLDADEEEVIAKAHVAVAGEASAANQAWLLRRDPKRDAIVSFAKRKNVSIEARASLIAWAARHELIEDRDLDQAANELLHEAPHDWSVHDELAQAYRRKHRQRAIGIVKGFLERKADVGPLWDVMPRIELASFHIEEKKYDAALAVLEPAVRTGAGGPMQWAAVTHARAGHRKEAEQLALAAWERYPQISDMTLTVAKVRWFAGDMKGAADALKKSPRTVDFVGLGRAFADVFADRPDDAMEAGEALRAAGLDRGFLPSWGMTAAIANHLLEHGAPKTALAVILPQAHKGIFVADKPAAYRFDAAERVLVFRALHAVKGKEEALAWLRAQLGDIDPNMILYVAFELGADDVFEIVGEKDGPDRWVFKIANELRRSGKAAAVDNARKVFAKEPANRYSTYGKYLLGDVYAAAIEALATTPSQTCEVAFLMAVRAEVEGRHRDAIALLRVARETRSVRDTEYMFAASDLGAYLSVGRAIDLLKPGYPVWEKPIEESGP